MTPRRLSEVQIFAWKATSSKPEPDMISPITWKFSLIKWKSPRCITILLNFISLFQIILYAFIAAPTSNVILTKGILTLTASFCKYSMYFSIVVNSVTLEAIGGRNVKTVLHKLGIIWSNLFWCLNQSHTKYFKLTFYSSSMHGWNEENVGGSFLALTLETTSLCSLGSNIDLFRVCWICGFFKCCTDLSLCSWKATKWVVLTDPPPPPLCFSIVTSKLSSQKYVKTISVSLFGFKRRAVFISAIFWACNACAVSTSQVRL